MDGTVMNEDLSDLSDRSAMDILTTLEERGTRLETVSSVTGIPYSTLRRWLSGTRFPRKDRYAKLVAFYVGGQS